MTGETLLDPAFRNELRALARLLSIEARSGASGERTSNRRGGSAEFHEHRPYAPGDDLRRVDWLAFARTGEPVVKQFRAEEDAIVRILLDVSASLDFGNPRKIEVARRLSAAIGYLALEHGERVQVLVARAKDDAPGARSLEQVSGPRRGRDALPALLRDLSAPQPGGSLDLARAIDLTVQRSARPGLLVILSDFLDAGQVTLALSRARSQGHQLSLVQVLSPEELEPPLEGDYSLVDSESLQQVEVTVDAGAVEAYVLRLTGLIEELRAWARKHGQVYLRVVTSEPLQGVMRRFVSRVID
ncbi:MAG TPA: DUF58 domain-containing protein [Polyangiaceae bacterium]|jgi:uncharacterized protein (DUF58 family)